MAESINHVSDTALWVAHYRALESDRPDALFHDPFAKILVGDRGRAVAKSMSHTSRYVGWTLVVRTCVIDSFIHELVKEGVDVVLNLGAGLDTRPYRMQLPADLLWIEVDYPHMIDHKEGYLSGEKPVCQLERRRQDLANREERRKLFADVGSRGKKVLVITEGVIPYLTEEQVGELGDDLRAQDSFQFWIAEHMSKEVYPYLRSKRRLKRMKNSPFVFFPEDWFGLFRTHGWVPGRRKFLVVESKRLGRKIPIPWWVVFLIPFATKKRKKDFEEYSSYVVFERV